MNKLSLKTKLGVGFGSLLIILTAMGLVAYNAVGQLAADLRAGRSDYDQEGHVFAD